MELTEQGVKFFLADNPKINKFLVEAKEDLYKIAGFTIDSQKITVVIAENYEDIQKLIDFRLIRIPTKKPE